MDPPPAVSPFDCSSPFDRSSQVHNGCICGLVDVSSSPSDTTTGTGQCSIGWRSASDCKSSPSYGAGPVAVKARAGGRGAFKGCIDSSSTNIVVYLVSNNEGEHWWEHASMYCRTYVLHVGFSCAVLSHLQRAAAGCDGTRRSCSISMHINRGKVVATNQRRLVVSGCFAAGSGLCSTELLDCSVIHHQIHSSQP